MPKQPRSNKSQKPSRTIYAQVPMKCPICEKICKENKKFESPFALMYHLSDWHGKEDETITGIQVSEIHKWIRQVCRAYEMGVLWV